jgi:type IV/VI secretion system ImpK/VasF family protein
MPLQQIQKPTKEQTLSVDYVDLSPLPSGETKPARYCLSLVEELKNKIIQEIQQFQITAQAEGVDPQTISSARYVMCTVLDEAVLNTPWGANSNWSQHSLLSLFHKEVSGGERFNLNIRALTTWNRAYNRSIISLWRKKRVI